jgi:hypothetical protein
MAIKENQGLAAVTADAGQMGDVRWQIGIEISRSGRLYSFKKGF